MVKQEIPVDNNSISNGNLGSGIYGTGGFTLMRRDRIKIESLCTRKSWLCPNNAQPGFFNFILFKFSQ